MTDQAIDVFFYGLFMDPDHLRAAGLVPLRVRRASVRGWALRIGRRATLVASADARSYGMLMTLTQIELDQLYSAPGLENYQATTVLAETLDAREPVRARCYNLPDAPGAHEKNLDYAVQLQGVLRRFGFPSGYVESVG